jgi:hypothetical protein
LGACASGIAAELDGAGGLQDDAGLGQEGEGDGEEPPPGGVPRWSWTVHRE